MMDYPLHKLPEPRTLEPNHPDPTTIQCYSCKEMGHKSYECPNPKSPPANATMTTQNESAVNHVHICNGVSSDSDGDDDIIDLAFSFYTKDQDGKEQTPEIWVLLDNQSTVDVLFNESLLENIRYSVSSLDVHCNAGVATVNKVGDFPSYGTVWFHSDGIATILSLLHDKEKEE